jgi:coatomer protein complex subunit gamma
MCAQVQEAVNSTNEMVQYHALALLYQVLHALRRLDEDNPIFRLISIQIKSHDRLAISKIVTTLSRGSVRSPLATTLLIRYTSTLLKEDINATNARAGEDESRPELFNSVLRNSVSIPGKLLEA